MDEDVVVPLVEVDRSYEAFFRREMPRLVALASALAGPSGAEDVAQEALLRAHRDWDHIGRYDKPGAWVRRVTLHLVASAARRRGSERRAVARLAARPASQAPDPLAVAADGFWALVRTLPARQATAVALYYLEDLTVADIAEVLGCAPAPPRSTCTGAAPRSPPPSRPRRPTDDRTQRGHAGRAGASEQHGDGAPGRGPGEAMTPPSPTSPPSTLAPGPPPEPSTPRSPPPSITIVSPRPFRRTAGAAAAAPPAGSRLPPSWRCSAAWSRSPPPATPTPPIASRSTPPTPTAMRPTATRPVSSWPDPLTAAIRSPSP